MCVWVSAHLFVGVCDVIRLQHVGCTVGLSQRDRAEGTKSTELRKWYLPRTAPRFAPSCFLKHPNVAGFKENTQSVHTRYTLLVTHTPP